MNPPWPVSLGREVVAMEGVLAETDRLAWALVTDTVEEQSEAEACLRSCVGKMLERHSMVFGGMMYRLNIDRAVDFRQGFTEVAEELFRDAVSWSKIVALFAFGARWGVGRCLSVCLGAGVCLDLQDPDLDSNALYDKIYPVP